MLTQPVTQPFDLALSIEFLRGFSPTAGEQRLTAGTIRKAWLHRGQPIDVSIAQRGDDLELELTSPHRIDRDGERAIAQRVSRFLSADEDLAPFYAIADADAAFAPVVRRLRGLHHVAFGTPFEAACWAVINQRIQLDRARAIKTAIVRAFGAPDCDAFPEAAALAAAGEREVARVVGHDRKAKAIWSVTQAFTEIDEAWLRTGPLDEVERWLRAIWGVGDFAAGFVLFRGLGRAISLPWSPKFVEAARATYPSCDRADLERRAASYGPWLGHWSLYLYAATFVAAYSELACSSSRNRSGQASRAARSR